jgi:hypothetical protein
MRHISNFAMFESVNAKDVKEFLTDFGWLISMNFSQIQQQAVDDDARKQLVLMMAELRKPILNGKKYSDFISDNFAEIPRNPKLLSAVLGIVRDYLVYMKPRIERFVMDGERKVYWLKKIDELGDTYRRIIQQ